MIRTADSERVVLDLLKVQKVKLRRIDSLNGLLSLVIIMFYVVEYEIFANGDTKKARFSSTAINHVLRTLMIILSAVVCFIQYFHYETLLQIQKILKLKDKRETI